MAVRGCSTSGQLAAAPTPTSNTTSQAHGKQAPSSTTVAACSSATGSSAVGPYVLAGDSLTLDSLRVQGKRAREGRTDLDIRANIPQCRRFLANPSAAIPNKLDCVFQYGIDPHLHIIFREPNLMIYKAATSEMVDRRFIYVITSDGRKPH